MVHRLVDVWREAVQGGRWRIGTPVMMLPVVLALATPSALSGQFAGGKLSIAPRVGFSLPAGQFSDYADAGPTAGLRIGYEIFSGGSLIFDAGFDNLKGTVLYPGLPGTARTPDMKLRHFVGGLEFQADPEATWPALLVGTLGAGAVTFESDPFRVGDQQTSFDYTGFTGFGGIEVGIGITSRLALVLDGKVFWTVVDEAKTEDLATIVPALLDPFDTAFTVPITIALRTRI